MNSTVVNREIKKAAWPFLREHGFAAFTSRSAWRHSAAKIEIVNFQSFNSYLADRIGATTFSFSLNLGCYLTNMPRTIWPASSKGEVLLPKEYECHLRRRLTRTFQQRELDRRDTWLIGIDGEYLAESVADALEQIQKHGLAWFRRFSDEHELLRTLREDDEGETWGIGAKDSPNRNAMIGYALLQSDPALAKEHFQAALKGLSKSTIRTRMTAQLERELARL